MWLIGASDLAASHARWDLLHRLGYRQFFPGETWEVVPQIARAGRSRSTRSESPSFHARRIWYNWGLWGYNDEPYRQWCARNRAVQGLRSQQRPRLRRDHRANRAEFEKHPEYLALVDGKRKLRGDAKFCISNAGLRKLVVDYAVAQFKKNPQLDSISMDPSDGGGWCECDACAQARQRQRPRGDARQRSGRGDQRARPRPEVRRHVRLQPALRPADASASTRTSSRAPRPRSSAAASRSTRSSPAGRSRARRWASTTTSASSIGTGICRAAARRRGRKRVAELLARIHGQGVRFYDAESGDCWGPCGLGYYVASRVLWDVREAGRVDAIVDGLSGEGVRHRRGSRCASSTALITEDTQRRSPSDIVGRMYRHLDAAREATDRPEGARARIDDLMLYTRHAELYLRARQTARRPKDDVARHAYRMRKTMMVHSYGLWARLLSQKAAPTANHPLKNEEPFTADGAREILPNGHREESAGRSRLRRRGVQQGPRPGRRAAEAARRCRRAASRPRRRITSATSSGCPRSRARST